MTKPRDIDSLIDEVVTLPSLPSIYLMPALTFRVQRFQAFIFNFVFEVPHMDNLNCSIEKAFFDFCGNCSSELKDDEYIVELYSNGHNKNTVCLPCIDKIRTELIKKNPTVELPCSTD